MPRQAKQPSDLPYVDFFTRNSVDVIVTEHAAAEDTPNRFLSRPDSLPDVPRLCRVPSLSPICIAPALRPSFPAAGSSSGFLNCSGFQSSCAAALKSA